MKIYDFHVHTNISPCAVPGATPEEYIKICQEKGITDIGFADHLWDEKVPGAFGWYKEQTTDRILNIRKNIPSDTGGVKVHIGCEVEMNINNVISISKENRHLFDYVLVATSHFHMKGYTIERNITDLKTVKNLLVSRFMKVVESEIASGIAHPFLAFGYFEYEQQLLPLISDNEYIGCFKAAKDANVSVELNGILVTKRNMTETNGYPSEYIRMMTLAKECGCKFHIGSDCHNPLEFNAHAKLINFAKLCGITEISKL